MTEDNRHDDRRSRRRLFTVAGLVAAGGVLVAVAIATDVVRLADPAQRRPAPDQVARDRCQSEVLKRLISPSSAQLSEVRAESTSLDPDGRDLFPLTLEEPLKGVDTSRIAVLPVTGVANAPTEVGSTLQDHFECRAYFVDGSLVHTLALFEHGH